MSQYHGRACKVVAEALRVSKAMRRVREEAKRAKELKELQA